MSLNLAVVHPLVLLSVVDHFNRSNLKRKQKKRVIGALLGEISGSKVEVSNCYALPFDEEDKESNVWFVDHLFHERMLKMFKKINAKEKFVGWYSTGTRFLPQDVHIFEVFRKYASKQVYLVVDVQNNNPVGLPTEGYIAKEQVTEEGEIITAFHHIETTVQAYQPEEIGVEHLLRELKDMTVDSLGEHISDRARSLEVLGSKLRGITDYLQRLSEGKFKLNSKILYILQNILNLLPELNSPDIVNAFTVKTNDQLFAVFVASLTQAVLSLHSVVQAERVEQEKEREREKEREKEQQAEKTEKKAEEA